MIRWWLGRAEWVRVVIQVLAALVIAAIIAVAAGHPVTDLWRYAYLPLGTMAIGGGLGRWWMRRRARERWARQ